MDLGLPKEKKSPSWRISALLTYNRVIGAFFLGVDKF